MRAGKRDFVARLPNRTLILMTLALFAFAWFWWKTHQQPAPRTPRMVLVKAPGGDDVGGKIDLTDGGVP